MRVFKPTYSKPLPEGAKTFLCKQGKDKGKMLARWKDGQGHTQTARLTKAGDKILCEVNHWHIEFDDHLGRRRKIKGHTSRDATEWDARQIQKLLDCKAGHECPCSSSGSVFRDQCAGSYDREPYKRASHDNRVYSAAEILPAGPGYTGSWGMIMAGIYIIKNKNIEGQRKGG